MVFVFIVPRHSLVSGTCTSIRLVLSGTQFKYFAGSCDKWTPICQILPRIPSVHRFFSSDNYKQVACVFCDVTEM